jgi:hypothetical protein
MMILLTLLIILMLFISFNNENFELLGTDDDIFQLLNETINKDVPCYVNGDTTNVGYETILTTLDKKNVQTCDFGDAKDKSCDHLDFKCSTDTCTEEKVIPLLNVNGDYKCRKIPYIF